MSQPRKNKAVGSGADRPRTRTSARKACGDSMACTTRPSRSKNKIPKAVRYDLENALIGLCDVWFEEIKPHLVRNNIKLHVQGCSAGGDHERPSITSSARLALPSPSAKPALPADSAPGCSHLDPGAAPDHPRRPASCAGYSSMLVTTARRTRQSASGRRKLSPLLSVPQTPCDSPQLQSTNCEVKTRRKHRRLHPKLQASWRVPRLCRTYTVLCRTGANTPKKRNASIGPPQPAHDNYHRLMPRRVMKTKTTQTEQAMQCVSRGCQSGNPGSRITAFRSPKRGSASCNPNPSSYDRTCFSPTLPPHNIHQLKQSEAPFDEKLPLFQDDLIDIIAGSNDKRLKLLYSSSARKDTPSCMNLLLNNRPEKCGLKKAVPWR